MTAKRLAEQFGVNITKVGLLKREQRYVAHTGGNSTGQPVVEIAEAYTLRTLAQRLDRHSRKDQP